MSTQDKRFPIAHDQTFFHLSVIQTISLGLPIVFICSSMAQQFGAGVAICSIVLGNLILWLIAIAIISMAIDERNNAIENVKGYLGKYGAFFMALVLIIAFVNWYVYQIHTSAPPIAHYFGITDRSQLVRLGAGLGFLTALLSIGGIRIIKWLTVASTPPVVFYYIYAVFQSDFTFRSIDHWGIALPAVISTVLILLPGVVNLPTFFRHARTKADCYLALTIMTIVISLFEISTIWMQVGDDPHLGAFTSKSSLFGLSTLVFILLTLITTNLLNIYFASACWESFAPKFEGAKGYAIVGLIGTAAYTFIQVYPPIQFMEDAADCYIGSLGVVLLIAFLVRIIVRHRPRLFEQWINGFCWFIGCLAATVAIAHNPADETTPLLHGVTWSAATFLVVLFVEETIWAIKTIVYQRGDKG